MAFEHRNGVCKICEGRITRYPHPQRDHPDVWAHLNKEDWLTNPHDPLPRQDGDCKDCGAAIYQHPTLPDRWAHLAGTPDNRHDAVPA